MECFERFHKNRPTLVLMAGFPGTGKTTLAKRLSQRLDWQVIDKDGIKERFMLEGLPRVLHCMVDDDVRMQRLQKRNARISQQNVDTINIKIDHSQFIHLPLYAFPVNTCTFSEPLLTRIVDYVTQ
ncbi:MAG: ATP-binding protein [Chloroflexota bacterium]|nr:ATP-binding protein [Chloroflexota bacterium]